MKYSHIIFDWDGTLMDSAAKIVSCMQHAAQRASLPIPSAENVHEIIGISLIPAIQQLFNLQGEQAKEVAQHYKEVFITTDQTPCPLFPKVQQTLHQLQKHCVLGVATGKARRGLERAFDATNSRQYFDTSICADEAESKPSPQMLEKLIAHWNVPASQVLMVGDTVYDMQMAEAIDMPRLGVSFGVHHEERLKQHNPVGILHHYDDLWSFITH
ncbi:HAD family hydrolase [Glaciecola sp. 1036]|uniref:HAD family hydrolase n=1 Tax=Alteromonadaceae TaxID=72275 RepID=UPI003D07BE9B